MSCIFSLEQIQEHRLRNMLMINTVPSQEGTEFVTRMCDQKPVFICSVGGGANSCSWVTISIFTEGCQEIFKDKF